MALTLPIDAAVALAEPAAGRQRKGTLLIVDDEDGARQSLRVIFKDEYELLLAGDGATAVQLAQNNKIDVAVLDIRMAGMSGIEVLERLKYVNPGIEAVMMTAYETTDTMRQALRLRACDYINKPFDVSTMRAAVATAMQRRTLEGEIHTNAEKLQKLLEELQSQKIEEQMATTRGEIYASIIHDINGPLTVISGFVQLMNQRIGNATRLEVEDLEFIKDRLRPSPARSPTASRSPAATSASCAGNRTTRRAWASTNCSRTLAIWSACIPACRATSSRFARWPKTSPCA